MPSCIRGFARCGRAVSLLTRVAALLASSPVGAQPTSPDTTWRVVAVAARCAPWDGAPALEVTMQTRARAGVLWLWDAGWRAAQAGHGTVLLTAAHDGMVPAAGRWSVCSQWDSAAQRCDGSWDARDARLELRAPWPWRMGARLGYLTVIGAGPELKRRPLIPLAPPSTRRPACPLR